MIPKNIGDIWSHYNWMRRSHTLPMNQWYDLQGSCPLDYPPLAAYLHYIAGWVARVFDPTLFSRYRVDQYPQMSIGYKWILRVTIIIVTVIFYYPPAIYVASKVYEKARNSTKLLVISLFLNMPVLLHIDYLNVQINALHIGIIIIHNR